VLINSVSGIAARILTAGVLLWGVQYLLKRIPEDELALLPLVMSVAVLLPLVQTVLTAGLARHVTEAYARNDLAEITRIVSSQFPLLLAGGALLMVIGGALAWNIHRILVIPPGLIGEMRFMLLLVLARLSLGMVLAPFNTGLFARQKFVLQNVVEVAGALIRSGLTILLILGVVGAVCYDHHFHVRNARAALSTGQLSMADGKAGAFVRCMAVCVGACRVHPARRRSADPEQTGQFRGSK
jgi:hypothetical protein